MDEVREFGSGLVRLHEVVFRASAVSSLLAFESSCGPHSSGAEMEAGDYEVYVREFCDYRSVRILECSESVPLPEVFEDFSMQECVECRLIGYLEDPCFAEQIEFSRCRQERLSCVEFFGQDIDTSPGSVCYDLFVVLGLCITRER